MPSKNLLIALHIVVCSVVTSAFFWPHQCVNQESQRHRLGNLKQKDFRGQYSVLNYIPPESWGYAMPVMDADELREDDGNADYRPIPGCFGTMVLGTEIEDCPHEYLPEVSEIPFPWFQEYPTHVNWQVPSPNVPKYSVDIMDEDGHWGYEEDEEDLAEPVTKRKLTTAPKKTAVASQEEAGGEEGVAQGPSTEEDLEAALGLRLGGDGDEDDDEEDSDGGEDDEEDEEAEIVTGIEGSLKTKAKAEERSQGALSLLHSDGKAKSNILDGVEEPSDDEIQGLERDEDIGLDSNEEILDDDMSDVFAGIDDEYEPDEPDSFEAQDVI